MLRHFDKFITQDYDIDVILSMQPCTIYSEVCVTAAGYMLALYVVLSNVHVQCLSTIALRAKSSCTLSVRDSFESYLFCKSAGTVV